MSRKVRLWIKPLSYDNWHKNQHRDRGRLMFTWKTRVNPTIPMKRWFFVTPLNMLISSGFRALNSLNNCSSKGLPSITRIKENKRAQGTEHLCQQHLPQPKDHFSHHMEGLIVEHNKSSQNHLFLRLQSELSLMHVSRLLLLSKLTFFPSKLHVQILYL